MQRVRAGGRWARRSAPEFIGGNQVRLLQGGDELFPAMHRGHRAGPARGLAGHLHLSRRRRRPRDGRGACAPRRGAACACAWWSTASAPRARWRGCANGCRSRERRAGGVPPGRPLVEPGCSPASCAACTRSCASVDREIGFRRRHQHHRRPRRPAPRLLRRAAAGLRRRRARPGGRQRARRSARAMWTRAAPGPPTGSDEVVSLAQQRAADGADAPRLMQRLRMVRAAQHAAAAAAAGAWRPSSCATTCASAAPSSAPTSRRSARARARRPGRRRTSTPAALSGARCAAPRSAACACGCCCRARSTTASPRWRRRCCTTSCAGTACAIYEYTPAFLHAKVALVDDDWATVGSSNIDPLSLLLNLEANVIVQRRRLHARAVAALRRRHRRLARGHRRLAAAIGWRPVVLRGFVAWCANWFLRMAGITGRY